LKVIAESSLLSPENIVAIVPENRELCRIIAASIETAHRRHNGGIRNLPSNKWAIPSISQLHYTAHNSQRTAVNLRREGNFSAAQTNKLQTGELAVTTRIAGRISL
jgi:hypothetical protein